ncbi:hypothetical protein BDZ94DRAFT_1243562 [Collybia nuda]|uniref:Transcription activator of gluconeogenesis ERT1 n=1 Tax=Collybia nuda TaxID=64659 RepID=A0A9P5YIH6_9AGAR|nr:hypothetical protein BDZ94DRAFT_1243562 [Collybia nuda]
MQNAHAGPSSVAGKKKSPPVPGNSKRKRTDTPDDSGGDSATQPRKGRDGPKKKKANRACFHCQKAHLTCDDSRPCQRCTKRGIANNCTEGHRKKAKYLLDEEELEQLKRSKSSAPESSHETTETFGQNETLFDASFSFGSEAANLEYSILSAILGNPSPPESVTSPPSPAPGASYSTWTADYTTSPRLGSLSTSIPVPVPVPVPASAPAPPFSSPYADPQMAVQPADTPYLAYPYSQHPHPHQHQLRQPDDYSSYQTPSQPQPLHPLQPRYPLDTRPRSPPAPSFLHSANAPTTSDPISDMSRTSQLQAIHDRVTAPYDYTEGYHFLMKHLPSRFEKNDILRIVRALAIFRPSLIALQMPLSLDDEIFVEKCFQRSLVELDKLISFSGTPTVVWRRTGEICLVAPEFCMLTEWSMDELTGRKKYIYELFENQSVVEYWENFAAHAFENTTQSVYSHCVLLKPSGAPVPATFCFSIRRDLFDLPSIVIGQWLPLL